MLYKFTRVTSGDILLETVSPEVTRVTYIVCPKSSLDRLQHIFNYWTVRECTSTLQYMCYIYPVQVKNYSRFIIIMAYILVENCNRFTIIMSFQLSTFPPAEMVWHLEQMVNLSTRLVSSWKTWLNGENVKQVQWQPCPAGMQVWHKPTSDIIPRTRHHRQQKDQPSYCTSSTLPLAWFSLQFTIF